MMKSLRHRLVALAAAALAFLAPVTASAEPAMWVVKDADSTIYLFGTIHVLPKGTNWRSPKIEAALAEADELYLEIADVSSIAAQIVSGVMLLRFGLSPSKPLSSRLTPEQYASLDKVARQVGLDARSLNIMRPWLAAMIIETGQMMTSDVDEVSGVDMQLQQQFQAKRTPIKGFETIGQQVRIFADLPEKDEVAYLVDTLESADSTSESFEELVKTWASGDVAGIGKEVVTSMKDGYPVLYDSLVVKRNTAWADEIVEMLKGSGTTFIAVGAAHLAGPDSVQTLLKARGVEAERK